PGEVAAADARDRGPQLAVLYGGGPGRRRRDAGPVRAAALQRSGPAGPGGQGARPPRRSAVGALPGGHSEPSDGNPEGGTPTGPRSGVSPRPRPQPNDRRGGGEEVPQPGGAGLRQGPSGPHAGDVLGAGETAGGGGIGAAVRPLRSPSSKQPYL